MRKCLLFILLIAATFCAYTQDVNNQTGAARKKIDSLQRLLSREQNDTAKPALFRLLAESYMPISKDSAFWYLQQTLAMYKKQQDIKGESEVGITLTQIYFTTGNYPQALSIALRSLKLAEQAKDTMLLFSATRALRNVYSSMNDFATAIEYARKAKAIVHSGYFKEEGRRRWFSLFGYLVSMTHNFEMLNQLDSAYHYAVLSNKTALALNDTGFLALTTGNLANTYLKLRSYDSAFHYYRKGIPLVEQSAAMI
jgi:tetratricopeptide (TPR) repeat protein